MSKKIKYWVVDVRTESGDEHGFILVSSKKPSEKAVNNYLKPLFPDEYEELGPNGVNFILHEAEPHLLEE